MTRTWSTSPTMTLNRSITSPASRRGCRNLRGPTASHPQSQLTLPTTDPAIPTNLSLTALSSLMDPNKQATTLQILQLQRISMLHLTALSHRISTPLQHLNLRRLSPTPALITILPLWDNPRRLSPMRTRITTRLQRRLIITLQRCLVGAMQLHILKRRWKIPGARVTHPGRSK